MKTIAKQLNIKTFPFIIKDDDGQDIYFEWSDGVWEKREWDGDKEICYENSDGVWIKREWDGDKVIRYENSNGIIVDNRPKTDVQKAIELLTKEGLLTDGKILKS